MQASVIAGQVSMTVIGAGMLAYLMTTTPPTLPDGHLTIPAVILLFAALFSGVAGLSGLVAGLLHRRWPALAGGPEAVTGAGLRQGILLGLAVCLLAFLAMMQILDVAIAAVVIVLTGLTESYIQARR